MGRSFVVGIVLRVMKKMMMWKMERMRKIFQWVMGVVENLMLWKVGFRVDHLIQLVKVAVL